MPALIIKSVIVLKSIQLFADKTNHFHYFAKVTIILKVLK